MKVDNVNNHDTRTVISTVTACTITIIIATGETKAPSHDASMDKKSLKPMLYQPRTGMMAIAIIILSLSLSL